MCPRLGDFNYSGDATDVTGVSSVGGAIGTGAAIGSVVPGVGTAAGGIIGGVVKVLGSIFGGSAGVEGDGGRAWYQRALQGDVYAEAMLRCMAKMGRPQDDALLRANPPNAAVVGGGSTVGWVPPDCFSHGWAHVATQQYAQGLIRQLDAARNGTPSASNTWPSNSQGIPIPPLATAGISGVSLPVLALVGGLVALVVLTPKRRTRR